MDRLRHVHRTAARLDHPFGHRQSLGASIALSAHESPGVPIQLSHSLCGFVLGLDKLFVGAVVNANLALQPGRPKQRRPPSKGVHHRNPQCPRPHIPRAGGGKQLCRSLPLPPAMLGAPGRHFVIDRRAIEARLGDVTARVHAIHDVDSPLPKGPDLHRILGIEQPRRHTSRLPHADHFGAQRINIGVGIDEPDFVRVGVPSITPMRQLQRPDQSDQAGGAFELHGPFTGPQSLQSVTLCEQENRQIVPRTMREGERHHHRLEARGICPAERRIDLPAPTLLDFGRADGASPPIAALDYPTPKRAIVGTRMVDRRTAGTSDEVPVAGRHPMPVAGILQPCPHPLLKRQCLRDTQQAEAAKPALCLVFLVTPGT